MKSRIIFNNPEQDKLFKEKGYIIIDLLDKSTAEKLYKKAIELDAGVDAPFYTSLWSKDRTYRKTVNQLIEKEIGKEAIGLFHEYVPFFGDLLVKRPSFTKDFPIHQDWTFVDEDIYSSVYVWVPLQDVNYLNGNLQVVEGSHLFLDKIRGANIKVSYEAIKPLIAQKYLRGIRLKAGQAIIFSQALLHASPPNRSFKTRIAMGLLMLPKEATIYHYFYDDKAQKIKRIKADKEFYMHYSENFDFQNALKTNTFDLSSYYDSIIIDRNASKMHMEDFIKLLEKK